MRDKSFHALARAVGRAQSTQTTGVEPGGTGTGLTADQKEPTSLIEQAEALAQKEASRTEAAWKAATTRWRRNKNT